MMKHTLKFILIGLFCCLCNFTVQAQTRNRQYEEYIHKYKDLAIDEMKRYRIPASITLAQGLLESGAGKSGARHDHDRGHHRRRQGGHRSHEADHCRRFGERQMRLL